MDDFVLTAFLENMPFGYKGETGFLSPIRLLLIPANFWKTKSASLRPREMNEPVSET